MSTIIYYRLLSKYCLLLLYSHYRFHYRNSVSTLEGLVATGQWTEKSSQKSDVFSSPHNEINLSQY